MKNVEQKFRILDPSAYGNAFTHMTTLCGAPPVTLKQFDTYYNVKDGKRFMLRCEVHNEQETATLIVYSREFESWPCERKSARFKLQDGAPIEDTMALLWGTLSVGVRVQKIRSVFTLNGVCVHFDEIKDLGKFIEFEYELDSQTPKRVSEGHAKLKELCTKLCLDKSNSRAESLGYRELVCISPRPTILQ